MELEIKKFEELTIYELHEILKARCDIFIVEQNCVYNDIDGKDVDAIHIMIKEKGKIVAYIRLLKPGVYYKDAAIGRVIVKEEARGKGYAKRIMQEGIDYITKIWGEDRITIGAQNYLKKFYSSLGFEKISDVYIEDGIPHIDMTYVV